MKKKTLFIFIAIIPTLFASANTIAEVQPSVPLITATSQRTSVSLDGKWHYIIDPYQNGYYDYRRQPHDNNPNPGSGAYFTDAKPKSKSDRVEYSFDQSPTMHIPGEWGTQVPELSWYEGTVWFKRDFQLSKKEGKRYFIYFGAANYETHVWVNGKKLGTHIGGFTPFNFEATDALEDGENFVVAMVDNKRYDDAVPTVATDWWNHGGITRSVKIIELPTTFIEDFSLQLSKDGSMIEGQVKLNPSDTSGPVKLSIPEVGIEAKSIADQTGAIRFSMPAESLEKWDLENPKLYDVTFETESDIVTDRIGFRTIEVSGQDILLNGKKIFLRGICMHEENPIRGRRNTSEADARMMFQWVQELNSNFVRLAHYPHNEHMPRIADELGILLWEEVPVYWTIQWENLNTLENAKNQLTELITRDKNRASVIIWSMANETPVSEPRNTFLGELVETARSLDNTRLISAAMEVHNEEGTKVLSDPFGKLTDIISFNQYHGWYGGNREDFPNLKWDIRYNKPVIVSEWGGGALYGYHADKDTVWSEEYQAFLYEKTLEGIFNIPGLSGVTPWILADFRSPRRPLPVIQDMWNRKGVIGEGGHKKQAFNVLKDFYANPDLEKR